jgi:hypothetical protein
MEFVEEFVARMRWVDQLRKFSAQYFNLLVIEYAYTGEIAVGVKEFDLVVGEAISIPVIKRVRRLEKIPNWAVEL